MIRARHIMCKRTAVGANMAGRELVFKLMATGCPGLPVVNGQMEVVGVITAFDILKAIRKGTGVDNITVESVMSQAPESADADTPLESLIDKMIANNFTIIPITHNKKLVGIVSRNEILEAYTDPHLFSAVA